MTSEAQKRAQAKYEATGVYYVLKVNLNRGSDADVIEKLERAANRQGYVKALIRRDLKGGAAGDRSAETREGEVR